MESVGDIFKSVREQPAKIIPADEIVVKVGSTCQGVKVVREEVPEEKQAAEEIVQSQIPKPKEMSKRTVQSNAKPHFFNKAKKTLKEIDDLIEVVNQRTSTL